jgi:hypothetical protein
MSATSAFGLGGLTGLLFAYVCYKGFIEKRLP